MMAPATNLYNLSNTGPRRQGQTRKSGLASLHGDRLKAQKLGKVEETEEDINAPPQDSSDEREAADAIEDDCGVLSEDSEFAAKKKRKARPAKSPSPSSPSRNPNIKPSKFCSDIWDVPGDSQKSERGSNGMRRSSQKRKSDHMSNDDMMGMGFMASQVTKTKKGASYGKAKVKNIHKAAPKKEGKPAAKRDSRAASVEKGGLKIPNLQGHYDAGRYSVSIEGVSILQSLRALSGSI